MRVAVVGAGISGLVSAYVLAKAGVEVVLYEKDDYLGGHARTVSFDGVDLDLGFMVFNRVTYPNMMEFFENLGIDMELSDMSFSVSLDEGQGCEWGSRNGLYGLFAQKKNMLNPYFLKMIREIIKFKDDVLSYLEMLENNPDVDRNETLGEFVKSRGYSELFQKAYLIPVCGSIWSCPSEGVMSFSAFSVLSFCRNHHLLQLFGRPQWLTVTRRSHSYVNKVREKLESWGCQIRTGCEIQAVSTTDEGCAVLRRDGLLEMYNGCVMAVHAPDALELLGKQATFDEKRILGAFQYIYSDIFLHRDKKFMPQNSAAWSAWNFLGSTDNKVCLTYWLNVLQNIDEKGLPFLVTLNPNHAPDHTLLKWSTGHPVPSVDASKASLELDHIQGKRRIWFCGAYQGYGFHEDGLKSGMVAAHGLLWKQLAILSNPKHMATSMLETGARLFVTRFLGHYISTGCLILLEEGGTVFSFEGTSKKCSLKTILKVHNPQFYWKIMTQADLGLADSYINGDISFVDKDEGLVNLFMSNELFALFLDETMTYSCGLFKTEDEDLKAAQMRKISLLIEKARICKDHEILEIGMK
uniref:Amine oxidase domain-containing protein n=1 Tax=Salix viminalis TaxID=40686 RepID=A0A6N2MNQ2_SALVM